MECISKSLFLSAILFILASISATNCYAVTSTFGALVTSNANVANGHNAGTSTKPGASDEISNADPYSGYNHAVYNFNQQFDRFLLKPVSIFYINFFPARVVKCVNNFYRNLSEIPTVINDLLQWNIYQMGSDTWRFAVNSTVGIGGLFDVASTIGIQKNTQDLGLTFAKWGYINSNYFVIPFIGPSTIRDALAFPLNYGITVYPYIRPLYVSYSLVGGTWVNQRAQLLDFEDVRKQAALNPYEFERNAYLQKRNYDIKVLSQSSVKKIGT